MNPKERQSLIEKIAFKFQEGGIKELETFGNFQKYSPLFHFQISEPFDLKQNFIYITELFGNERITETIPATFEGARIQYQGNYDWLNQIVLQGITISNIVPYPINNSGLTFETILGSPTFQLNDITNDDREAFDNALLYFKCITNYQTPKIKHLDPFNEFFSSTHNIWLFN